ncbi:RIN4 pathogenic type III effector avirulence factor Avr cleavage site domain-containing protein, partial [Dioscorea alata]
RKEWTPVPEFGEWDRNNGSPNYSMVFSNARANRKQRKTTIDRSSFAASTDDELIVPQGHQPLPSLPPPPPPPPMKRKI